ncbi:FAD-dependent oxidoreductase [Puniceicoccaceae bacterium K14]|nr:FAD-dependent oxidoreductase [Puniceicoccaceae bacterium K14]
MENASSSSVFDCVVVGAGISGLMAAARLQNEGYSCIVLDKGRGVGGRMATRRLEEGKCDHGAQFFTVSDDRFAGYVDKWKELGLVFPWFGEEEGRIRYRAHPGMTGIAKYLAKDLNIKLSFKVDAVSREDELWSVSAAGETVQGRSVLMTCPVPQAVDVLEGSSIELDPKLMKDLKQVKYRKAQVAMLRLDGPSGIASPGFIKLKSGGPLDVISDNQQKGVSESTTVTVHSSHDFADEFFDKSKELVLERLVAEAKPYLKSNIVETSYHRWGFAHRVGESDKHFAMDISKKLWFSGDSFGQAKVEGAALNGLAVAESIAVHI